MVGRISARRPAPSRSNRQRSRTVLPRLIGPVKTVRLRTVAVLRFGDNNHVVLTPTLFQLLDDAVLHAVGLQPEAIDILAIKSRVHFRAFYGDVSGAIIEIDAPGLGPADLSQHHYEHIPPNLYPLTRS